MRDYIIMTDSCCDLSQQEVEELELTVLPLSFTIEGKTLLNTPDHADMSPEEFFAKIAAGADCRRARTSSASAFRARCPQRISPPASRRKTCAKSTPRRRS